MSNQQRNELLQTIIADPNSTAAERFAAEKEMNVHSQPLISQDVQDKDLESDFYPRTKRSSGEWLAWRSQLSPATLAILNDVSRAILGAPPAEGAAERLSELIARTRSDKVREGARSALRSAVWFEERKNARGPGVTA